ncbi:MAG TPA: tetraacyldisaccharide 4'-kinase [Pyrinomonadaceae bacterium]|nr:tetraacyldisaccharide 4'-kinase [Pyrinomonadaceae bacterium]
MKSLLLPPLSTLYGAVTKTRLSLYRRGTFHTTRLERPVISIGNITAGGTGKTPLVEWVARTIANHGKNVCILTRGYGREQPQRQVVVSDGQTILATPAEAGDEPYLLATKLLGSAAIICNADRISAGRDAIEVFGSDCFVLDDGFQHLRLARDLNIVTIDATNPWGGGQLLPYGRLREPISGLSRADCVVLTRADQVTNTTDLCDQIRAFIRGRPLFLSTMRPARAPITNEPVAAFCAVGNPQSFFADLKKAGYEVLLEKTFADHHWYTQRDIDELTAAATAAGAQSLITTAKDAVKLRSLSISLPYHVFEIEIAIEDEETFRNLILKAAKANDD